VALQVRRLGSGASGLARDTACGVFIGASVLSSGRSCGRYRVIAGCAGVSRLGAGRGARPALGAQGLGASRGRPWGRASGAAAAQAGARAGGARGHAVLGGAARVRLVPGGCAAWEGRGRESRVGPARRKEEGESPLAAAALCRRPRCGA
jgi:hypothetical protein